MLTTIRRMILAFSGTICLFLGGFTLYKTMPREGRPPSAWTRTETRAISIAMLVLVLLLAGITMVAKGIFG
ncbi:MAG TPA: hypothetical protein VLF65_19735 [Burkholderiales bacterium]|nr:hypothetical protein [Burkholderiales bacterium]